MTAIASVMSATAINAMRPKTRPRTQFKSLRRIGFHALLNKINAMWKPLNPVQLMDLENDFYLVRFNNEKDYNSAGRTFVGLPEGYYSDFLLRAIRQAIGPVVKLDTHIDFARRGKFVHLAVCVDLKKPAEGCESMKSSSSDVGNGSASVVDEK
ncbi:hypothetical protein Goarm_006344 [Gossypium armourianum]|uniref:DUF4283 domain-containing protein n=1 Tax=Gossypium armourianum TaxID=34283 RepID=A0A7J9JI62_9ROSI|nr:hypothetical protein [Gossypium armourianum]